MHFHDDHHGNLPIPACFRYDSSANWPLLAMANTVREEQVIFESMNVATGAVTPPHLEQPKVDVAGIITQYKLQMQCSCGYQY